MDATSELRTLLNRANSLLDNSSNSITSSGGIRGSGSNDVNISTSNIDMSSILSKNGTNLINDKATTSTAGSAVTTTAATAKSDYNIETGTIKYGMDIAFRGKLGKYLTCVKEEASPLILASTDTNTSVSTSIGIIVNIDTTGSNNKETSVYTLSANGQGIGETNDTFILVNADDREDNGYIRYGRTVALRSHYGKDRYLGVREGTKLGLYRSLIGQGEKWIVVKKKSVHDLSSSSGITTTSSNGSSNGTGDYVKSGDTVILQTLVGNNVLCLYDGITGHEAKLVNKDRTALDYENWQLLLTGAQPIPTWSNRPYLNDRFSSKSLTGVIGLTAVKTSGNFEIDRRHDIEARLFPSSSCNDSGSGSSTVGSSDINSNKVVRLDTLSIEIQHAILMKEVLTALTGINGIYIRLSTNASDKKMFVLDHDSIDRSLANEVMSLLQICDSAMIVKAFIKVHGTYEFGMVLHALGAAMKSIMRKYDLLVTQLECLLQQNQLTMQKLTFLLQPSKTVLNTLELLAVRIQGSSGGCILDILHNCLLERGDRKSKELCMHLLQKASEPYMSMLSLWLLKGHLSDPYHEFLVSEDKQVTRETLSDDFNSQYWERRYVLNEAQVPIILRAYAVKALTSGKYLNVVREANNTNGNQCSNIPIDPYLISNMVYNPIEENTIPRVIEASYSYSSRSLLQLLEHEHGLSIHLRSLRRFFLLEHGDFFIQFMDTAEDELRRDVKNIVVSRIQNLLQLAVQTSTLSNDPHREDLECTLAPHNLIQHLHLIQSAGESTFTSDSLQYRALSQGLKGVEALTLDYHVQWPISIVLSRRSITKYQLLARLLYFSKHVESRLLSLWKGHQGMRDSVARSLLGTSFCLRHRMLHFMQNLVYYMTLEVIGPRSHELEERLSKACDMDEVLAIHERFLDTCLEECLLASQGLLKILTKIMSTCLLFAEQINRVVATIDEISTDSFTKMLAKFSDTFDVQLSSFLDLLMVESRNHHVQLSNLCVRLDYNGFYTSKRGQ